MNTNGKLAQGLTVADEGRVRCAVQHRAAIGGFEPGGAYPKPSIGGPLRLRKTGIGRPRTIGLLPASSVSATAGKSGRSAA